MKIDSEATIYFSPENAKPKRKLPPNVEDFDSECGTDPFQTPQYAQDIFLYFKQREVTLSSTVSPKRMCLTPVVHFVFS